MKPSMFFTFLALISAPILGQAQIIHLDCEATITLILGEDLYGKSQQSVGDKSPAGPYKFDIDMENETAKMPGFSNETLSANPSDPQNTLAIGETQITYGKVGETFWYMTINRVDLAFRVTYGLSEGGNYHAAEGTCVLVENREVPERAF